MSQEYYKTIVELVITWVPWLFGIIMTAVVHGLNQKFVALEKTLTLSTDAKVAILETKLQEGEKDDAQCRECRRHLEERMNRIQNDQRIDEQKLTEAITAVAALKGTCDSISADTKMMLAQMPALPVRLDIIERRVESIEKRIDKVAG